MRERKRDGVSVEEAVGRILDAVSPIERILELPLLECVGRVLAEDRYAGIDNPPFDRAPVDGYACRAFDTKEASKAKPVVLKVLREIDAGGYFEGTVGPGEAVRIMTGAPIPSGCDVCIRQEDTDYGEEFVRVYEEYAAYQNYCYAGEDFKKGQLMVKAGSRLTYVEIAVLASMGAETLPVYDKPAVALFTTGDEIVMPGKPLRPGKIYNSNLPGLAARMQELGFRPILAKQIGDEGAAVAEEIRNALAIADVVITTGGVSVGKKDILHDALPLLQAERKFWGVAMKPGTPVIFSVYKGKPIISLSGNPFGALTNFELLIRPMLAKLCRDESLIPVRREAVMAAEFGKASHGRRFIRAIYREGRVYLPEGLHSSGVLASMRGCNCLVDIVPGTECLKPGDKVSVVMTCR
ncbi:MAG: molybdopterin molybdotransferase MoeA [Lachnospiraceae bacterium]|nr:molybdopterin molybdotransferase MoeA [Lachnospiraceae bacterium]